MHGVQKDLQSTTEFFLPTYGLDVAPYIEADHKQGIHHVGRYQWASSFVASLGAKRIIDVACGSGYGSKMLADAAPDSEVSGIDYDNRAVEYARDHYSAPNLSYHVGDLTTWTTGEESIGPVDAVVSFDTIEHLLHREIALLRICDNLTDRGALIFSTPCGHRITRLNPGWEHHKIEYSHHDLRALLKRFFKRIIEPGQPEFPNQAFWDGVINRDRVRYLLRFNPIICLEPIRQ